MQVESAWQILTIRSKDKPSIKDLNDLRQVYKIPEYATVNIEEVLSWNKIEFLWAAT